MAEKRPFFSGNRVSVRSLTPLPRPSAPMSATSRQNQPLLWTAAGLLEAEKKFRRIKGYQEILLLKERLNPSRI
jgi:hypothetical protein